MQKKIIPAICNACPAAVLF